jgi:primosomal protein N' (replication factor Y)
VAVVDMRQELREGNRSVFSRALRSAVEGALERREQVILFVNRRGHAQFMLCRDCGHVPRCPACATAFALHARIGQLVCHQCNRKKRPPDRCPDCGGNRLKPFGLGSERLEEEARRNFPGARVLRWDSDATRGKGSHDRLLQEFSDGGADILVGTQMLARGLDVEKVTVVGVVDADVGLNFPDFRSAERSYQLLEQVAGRAGRGGLPGEVYIQTYEPEHPVFEAVASGDQETFYAAELAGRRRLAYPPFRRLVKLTYAHLNEERARQEAYRLAAELVRERNREGVADPDILGPTPSFQHRLRGRYRWQVVLRGTDPAARVRALTLKDGWTVDVDPVSLL